MQKQQAVCLHALADSRDQMRRFNDVLDNGAVSRDEMRVRGQLTAQRAAGRALLVVADASEQNYTQHRASVASARWATAPILACRSTRSSKGYKLDDPRIVIRGLKRFDALVAGWPPAVPQLPDSRSVPGGGED